MTDMKTIFYKLGLEQYLQRFQDEGFESWEEVLDIQESDLESLGVKLGHRRRLQREIINARGTSSASANSSTRPSVEDYSPVVLDAQASASTTNQAGPVITSKRKYRRHPKTDENAPARGPSAYVLFSNEVREELKVQRLSFTDIAKRVGEKWQMLAPEVKAPYEAQAASYKERYHADMLEYKTTAEYQAFAQYLDDFKAKHQGPNPASNSHDSKRPRRATDTSTESFPSSIPLDGGTSNTNLDRQGWDTASDSTASVQNSPMPPAPRSLGFSNLAQPSPPSHVSFHLGFPRSAPAGPMYASDVDPQQSGAPVSRREIVGVAGLTLPIPDMLARERTLPEPRRSDRTATALLKREESSKSSTASGSTSSSKGSSESAASPFAAGDYVDYVEARRLRNLPLPVRKSSYGEVASLGSIIRFPPDSPSRLPSSATFLHPAIERHAPPPISIPHHHSFGISDRNTVPEHSSEPVTTSPLDNLSMLALAGMIVDEEAHKPP